MAQIYDQGAEELHVLLDKAANQQGATLVIPDLQRPYVWSPNQVSLLVDSLVRGWPFGTLLLWKVENDTKRGIPSRAFWTIVDRTGAHEGHVLLQKQLPASYQMVLDGQQRVQSLLLATHGDNWGFRLPDKDWGVETGSKSAKGKTNNQHWSLGSLCLDLEKFLSAYRESAEQISALEFEKALTWAVTDEADGYSKVKTSAHYARPIPQRYGPENKANLIRFCRFWELAGANPNLKEKNYIDGIQQLLKEHEVPAEEHSKYITPIAELLTTLRDVKLQKISFLELRPFDQETMDRDAYDDAIVNIFTRLNTAGRTLTREEITFAWLKVGWALAQSSFADLQEDLKANGLELDIDDLVSAVSFMWAVAHNDGKVLTNRDLLQGDIIRPMAATLAQDWAAVSSAIKDVARVVHQRELLKGKVFASINALVVIWAAHFLFFRRSVQLVTSELQRDSLLKTGDRLLNAYIDRWLAGSSWAQRWASAGGKVLTGYALAIAGDSVAYNQAANVEDCTKVYRARLEHLIADIQPEAETHIGSRLGVEAREHVRQYFGPLWLWHRLDVQRWNASRIPLRIGNSRTDLDVDHVVSVKIWANKPLEKELLNEQESVGAIVNSLGNCALLQKSFNIIKSGAPLRNFMCKVHEFKDAPEEIDKWAAALQITQNQLDGDKADQKQLVEDVRKRDQQIRADLIRFIRGELQRADTASMNT
jgi:Protein of unknown function DUF262